MGRFEHVGTERTFALMAAKSGRIGGVKVPSSASAMQVFPFVAA